MADFERLRVGVDASVEPATYRAGDDVIGTQARGGNADCCGAQIVFRVVLPSTAVRRRAAELTFCSHHQRVHVQALSRLGAVVYDASGSLIAS